ncbi:MAG: hypothetical protein MJZ00_00625 [Paludibacteraceae bacterium]|nr:hypothetical protein [Paludibacteraceae bacterium]
MIKFRPSKSLTYYFDRSFSGSWWKQILWLSGAVMFAFCFFWCVSLFLFPDLDDFECVSGSREPEGRLMLLFRLFYDPGSIDHLSYNARTFGVVVVLVGMVLFMGMLITVISNILERHIDRYMRGYFDFGLNNHHVVLGYNKTTPGLIKSICKEDDLNNANSFGHRAILLVSEKNCEDIRKELNGLLSRSEFDRVILKSGSRNSNDILNEVSLGSAVKLWIVGEEDGFDHDSLNIECVSRIVKMCRKGSVKRESKLDVHVYLDNQSAFRTFQSVDMSCEWRDYINFKASNFNDDWARYVMVDRGFNENPNGTRTYLYPALENPSKPLMISSATENRKGVVIKRDSDAHVHVMVFGMTDMGLSMAVRAAHLLHLPNFTRDKKLKTVISFVDVDADTKMVEFRNVYQYLFEIQSATYKDFTGDEAVVTEMAPTKFKGEDADFLDSHFEFIKSNAHSPLLRKYIEECADDKNDVLSIMLCYDDPDYNLQVGQNFPFNVYFQAAGVPPVPVYVRQYMSRKLVDELRTSEKFRNFYPFGMYTEHHRINETDELRSKAINLTYNQCYKKGDDVYDSDGNIFLADLSDKTELEEKWSVIQTSLQWSNAYCLDCFYMRRRNMGDEEDHLKMRYHKDDPDLLMMAEVEHYRWTTEKLLMGFRKPSEDEMQNLMVDEELKLYYKKKRFVHLDIQSYQKLKRVDPKTFKYDAIIVANVENIMRLK